MRVFERRGLRALTVAIVLVLSCSTVLASRASSSRSGGGDGEAKASRSSGSAASSRGRASSSGGATVRAGGRASWRQGYRHGGIHVPHHPRWGYGGYWDTWGPYGYAWYDPWYWQPWGGWYGWYGGAAWAIRGVPVYAVAVREAGLPGRIETDVRPGKARVVLDGDFVGYAKDYNGLWDVLEVAPGRHTLTFERDGYRTLRIDLDVDPGVQHRIERRLSRGEGPDPTSVVLPEPEETPARARDRRTPRPGPAGGSDAAPAALARGLLRLDVGPDDAAVYLDGQYLGTAGELARLRGALPVAQGVHRVDVVRPGHVAETVEVEVVEGETARVEIALEPR